MKSVLSPLVTLFDQSVQRSRFRDRKLTENNTFLFLSAPGFAGFAGFAFCSVMSDIFEGSYLYSYHIDVPFIHIRVSLGLTDLS